MSQHELADLSRITGALLAGAPAIRVYRLALKSSVPMVGARFGSVFLEDERIPAGGGLLKLACALNWPQSAARYLSAFRVRVGLGATGSAVASGAAVEVPDVFADPTLEEWWEPARELGFAALASFPLRGRAAGAVSYYFGEPYELAPREREVLSLYADLIGMAADRERLHTRLRVGREPSVRGSGGSVQEPAT